MILFSRRVARASLAGVVLALSALPQLVRAQTGTVCTCADIYDLINRLNMARAARAELLAEIPKIEAADRAAGTLSHMDDPNNASNQESLRSAIKNGMTKVQMPGASTSAGKTQGDCSASIATHGTACMEEIVMWHEEHVHVPACKSGAKNVLGFRAPLTTIDYVKEEIAGYEAEIQRIKDVLLMLPPSCRPSGWIGHIWFHEELKAERNNTLEPTTTRVSASEVQSQTMIRDTKILYREANAPTTLSAAVVSPRASTDVNETVTMFSTSTLRRGCVGGLGTPRFDGTITTTGQEDIKSTGTGERDIDVSFEYDPQTGKYTLAFDIPDADATGSIVQKETVSGSCKSSDDGTKTSPSVPTSRTYDGQRVRVSGTVLPQSAADMVHGQDSIDLGPRVSLPTAVSTYTGTARWAFFKLP